MATIKSNFNSTLVLCGGIVEIWTDEHARYQMRLPILKDKLEERDYDSFLGFCATPIEVINMKLGTNFKDRLDIFKFYKNNNDKKMVKMIIDFCSKYMINFEYVDDALKWNKRIIPRVVLNYFCDYFAIASGVKSIKDLDLIITDDMDEFEKMRIQNEIKIAKTKKQGDSNNGPGPGLDKIIAGICHEFNYTIQQVYNLTIYAIYYLYSQFGAIMSYDINNIAAGNGLLKKNAKHTH